MRQALSRYLIRLRPVTKSGAKAVSRKVGSMKRSKLIEYLQTLEFLNVNLPIGLVTEARLRAGNPWPDGLKVVSDFHGRPVGPGENPRWDYKGLVYEAKPGEWYLTYAIEKRRDEFWTCDEHPKAVAIEEVTPWLYKPMDVHGIRSIKLRSITNVRLYETTSFIEDG
jgi:hypothetical protein